MRCYTPLFVVLVMIGITDVIFAVDSIPAIFAITTDPFIVLTSNVFAVLGLRALYFLLAGMAERFHLLTYGLALVLVFIGTKMLLVDWMQDPGVHLAGRGRGADRRGDAGQPVDSAAAQERVTGGGLALPASPPHLRPMTRRRAPPRIRPRTGRRPGGAGPLQARAEPSAWLAVIVLGAVFFAAGLDSPTCALRAAAAGPGRPARRADRAAAARLGRPPGARTACAVLILGTLAGTVFPRATLRALPLIWLGSGLGTWLIATGGFHLGASGVTHGLGFLVFTLGVLRRDRPAIAAALIAFFFFGGMLVSVLPHEIGVSWEYHLAGAVVGRARRPPVAPRRPGAAAPALQLGGRSRARSRSRRAGTAHADDVPVLWQRRPEPTALGRGAAVSPAPGD